MLTALIGPVTSILDKFIPDADEKAKLAHDIATMSQKHTQEALLAQLEINKAEAQSGSLFKGGWRPAVGWVCAISFAYHFLKPFTIEEKVKVYKILHKHHFANLTIHPVLAKEHCHCNRINEWKGILV